MASEWTVDTVKEHFDDLREADQRAIAAALAAAEKANEKADLANNKRFDGTNEFREQLNDQAATFITRKESEAKLDGVMAAVAINTTNVSRCPTRGEIYTGLGATAAVATMLGAVIGHFLK